MPAAGNTTEERTEDERGEEVASTGYPTEQAPEWPDLALTLYVRPGASTVTKDRQSQIRARFERLADIGIIGDLAVEEWHKQVDVPTEGQATNAAAVERFDEFKEAAALAGARLNPFFEERPQVSSFFSRSTTDRVIVFPVLGVTVRRDGELVGLFPCWRDGVHYSVGDCLDMLEDGKPVTNLE
jgi:hypothetical protein